MAASRLGEGAQHANHPEPRKSPCEPLSLGSQHRQREAGMLRARCWAAAAAGGGAGQASAFLNEDLG